MTSKPIVNNKKERCFTTTTLLLFSSTRKHSTVKHHNRFVMLNYHFKYQPVAILSNLIVQMQTQVYSCFKREYLIYHCTCTHNLVVCTYIANIKRWARIILLLLKVSKLSVPLFFVSKKKKKSVPFFLYLSFKNDA